MISVFYDAKIRKKHYLCNNEHGIITKLWEIKHP